MPSPLERAWLRADRFPCSIPESSLYIGSQAILSEPGDVPNSQSLSSQITNTCVYTPKKEAFWYIFSGLSMSSLVEDPGPDHTLRQTKAWKDRLIALFLAVAFLIKCRTGRHCSGYMHLTPGAKKAQLCSQAWSKNSSQTRTLWDPQKHALGVVSVVSMELLSGVTYLSLAGKEGEPVYKRGHKRLNIDSEAETYFGELILLPSIVA